VNRNVFFTAAMAAALVRPAMADDVTISSRTTTPIATSSASNSSAGNITITPGGSVEVSTSGAAVTLDSNNTIVNKGIISNTMGSTSSGVHIVAGQTGSFLSTGTINVPGTKPDTATDQNGILLDGDGQFSGDIVAGNGSSITVSGLNAQAVSIRSDLIGNLTLGGTLQATGTTARGVFASASIQGAFVNNGNISALGGGTSTTTINADPGAAAGFGGNVGGGILNAGPVNTGDATVAASITVNGGMPALIIAPSIGGNVGDINIGVLSDANHPDYSIINRGRIAATGEQPGISTIGLQVGNGVGDSTGLNTILAGGILNSGSITASARSDNKNATSVAASASSATTVIIGAGATVPAFDNLAGGIITASISGPAGGTSNAMMLASGSTLSTLNNAGLISANAESTDTSITALFAEAIYDASGRVTTVTNSGTISATATRLDGGTQSTIAAYLGSTSAPVTFTNTGTVIGDITFGTGSNNWLTIEGQQASVTGKVSTTNSGRVNIAISSSGTGGSLVTSGAIRAGTLTVGAGGVLDLGIGTANGISASGNATFDATSYLRVTPLSLLPSDANITLIHSDTSLSFGDLSATTAEISIPFLFTGNLSSDSRNLILNLHRKTAGEVGLTGDDATLYDPALLAASVDSDLGSGLID